jgi:hypothetical protein
VTIQGTSARILALLKTGPNGSGPAQRPPARTKGSESARAEATPRRVQDDGDCIDLIDD